MKILALFIIVFLSFTLFCIAQDSITKFNTDSIGPFSYEDQYLIQIDNEIEVIVAIASAMTREELEDFIDGYIFIKCIYRS